MEDLADSFTYASHTQRVVFEGALQSAFLGRVAGRTLQIERGEIFNKPTNA